MECSGIDRAISAGTDEALESKLCRANRLEVARLAASDCVVRVPQSFLQVRESVQTTLDHRPALRSLEVREPERCNC